jgi:hypothetical protein
VSELFSLGASLLERTLPANTKLEPAAAVVELVVMDRDAVVKPQRPDRQIEAQANSPVVAEIAKVET